MRTYVFNAWITRTSLDIYAPYWLLVTVYDVCTQSMLDTRIQSYKIPLLLLLLTYFNIMHPGKVYCTFHNVLQGIRSPIVVVLPLSIYDMALIVYIRRFVDMHISILYYSKRNPARNQIQQHTLPTPFQEEFQYWSYHTSYKNKCNVFWLY